MYFIHTRGFPGSRVGADWATLEARILLTAPLKWDRLQPSFFPGEVVEVKPGLLAGQLSWYLGTKVGGDAGRSPPRNAMGC